jgi:hypothetical protein
MHDSPDFAVHTVSCQLTESLSQASLVPRPSRAPAKEGLVSNVRFLGCAESACVRKLPENHVIKGRFRRI